MNLAIMDVGGPTALLEIEGVRFLTDPTFDPAGQEYRPGPYVLRKTAGPSVAAQSLAPVHVVLLSHDHHFDNLDNAGRSFLGNVGTVFTTMNGASRLGDNAVGFAPWQTTTISTPCGRQLRITATPAQHGPVGGERGPVIGFVVSAVDDASSAVYVSGDTVWFDGIHEVSRRFRVSTALLFMGGARIPEVEQSNLTLTASEGVAVARTLTDAMIVPLHCEGWAHYSESSDDIRESIRRCGLRASGLLARTRTPNTIIAWRGLSKWLNRP
jgi:L-ascorbate metabolism protein UlaG (beta-lactamase superfamily)